MLSYTREEVKKMAAQAAEVEIYRFNQADRYIRGIHTDNTDSMDVKVDDLPDEFKGDVQLMDEEEYENTLLANSSMSRLRELVRRQGCQGAGGGTFLRECRTIFRIRKGDSYSL